LLSFNITAGKPVGLALVPSELKERGELVVLTTNRLTEMFHSGAMTRNLPLLSQLVLELFAYIPEPLASKLGIKPGDYVEIATARGDYKAEGLCDQGGGRC
jgi:formate dehydrogenase major subunit